MSLLSSSLINTEHIAQTIAFPTNIATAYNGDFCAASPATTARSELYIFDGSSIIPFDTASGVGYVSSTVNPKARGVRGIAPKPRSARLTVKSATFLVGRVSRTRDMSAIEAKLMSIKVSLNLWERSRRMPVQIEPRMPEMMKTPPKSELFYTV